MKDVLTLPNAITLSRILAIPILILLFFWGPLWLFYAVLALVLASDLVDGALARSQRQITALGKLLDPIADKMLFLSLFVALTVEGRLPWWALIAFAVPPLVLLCGGAVAALAERSMDRHRGARPGKSFLNDALGGARGDAA
jgi:cardiolipin synthase